LYFSKCYKQMQSDRGVDRLKADRSGFYTMLYYSNVLLYKAEAGKRPVINKTCHGDSKNS